jgi:hypothetical protein
VVKSLKVGIWSILAGVDSEAVSAFITQVKTAEQSWKWESKSRAANPTHDPSKIRTVHNHQSEL